MNQFRASAALMCLLLFLAILDFHVRNFTLPSDVDEIVNHKVGQSHRQLYAWTPRPQNPTTNDSPVVSPPSKTNKDCEFDFKLYIYELPPHLIQNAEDARKNGTYHVCRKCIFEQFALEYIVYDYFHSFCARTYNPEEADFFYLPIIREIDYRIALSNGGNRNPSIIESALINAIEKDDLNEWLSVFNVTDKYWKRHKGADHIIVMPAPVTNLRHQSSARGFFHYVSVTFNCCLFTYMFYLNVTFIFVIFHR